MLKSVQPPLRCCWLDLSQELGGTGTLAETLMLSINQQRLVKAAAAPGTWGMGGPHFWEGWVGRRVEDCRWEIGYISSGSVGPDPGFWCEWTGEHSDLRRSLLSTCNHRPPGTTCTFIKTEETLYLDQVTMPPAPPLRSF